MMRVEDVMSSPAVVVDPGEAVKHAARVMDVHGFTSLPVVSREGRLVGVVGEAQLLDGRFPPDPRIAVAERSADVPGRLVGDVMVRDVLVAHPREGVADLLVVLQQANARFVPVVDGGSVVGVVTYHDLVHAFARDDESVGRDVRRRLVLRFGADRWAVAIDDGEVTLTAERADAADRSLAMRLAESVIGLSRCRVVSLESVPAELSS
jgi:CBS domain-containing protein